MNHSGLSPSGVRNLMYVLMAVAVIGVVFEIIGFTQGDLGIWQWIGLACWVFVIAASGHRLSLLSKGDDRSQVR